MAVNLQTMKKENKEAWGKIVICAAESPKEVTGLTIPIDLILSIDNELKALKHMLFMKK